MLVEIYTDGAYSSSRKQGGWAVVAIRVGDPQNPQTLSGYSTDATNNTMEMEAMTNALQLAHTYAEIDPTVEITIISDSEYVLLGIQEWLPGWKSSNWKKGKLKNLDLWKEIDSLVNSGTFKLSFQWTRGHIGNVGNEMADELAGKMSRKDI